MVLGPTVAIQLDAVGDRTGDGATPMHSLWRDPERDLAEDLLARPDAQEHEEAR